MIKWRFVFDSLRFWATVAVYASGLLIGMLAMAAVLIAGCN